MFLDELEALTCLEWGDDNVLLLRECGGLHTGDDFSRPLASDWLRLSGELQESMSERRTQVFGLVERELLQSAKSRLGAAGQSNGIMRKTLS